MTEQVYHILITRTCDHKCPICCNRLYDLDKLPAVTQQMLSEAHTVCLTGGEPFRVAFSTLLELTRRIRTQFPNIQKLYIYTSGGRLGRPLPHEWRCLFKYVDGLSVSPKSAAEWVAFSEFIKNDWVSYVAVKRGLSNRLYVFDEQIKNWESVNETNDIKLDSTWQIIGRKWDKTFNTPENEHFVRLPILY